MSITTDQNGAASALDGQPDKALSGSTPAETPRLIPHDYPGAPTPLKPTGRMMSVASSVGWAFVGLAVFAALWQFGAARVDNFPSPADTFTRLRHLLANAFYDGGPNDQGVGLMLRTSLTRVFTGFGIAAIIGIPLGLAMGSSARTWKAMNPLAQLLRPVSPLAWYPVVLIIFLDADKASVWVICLTSLWPIVLNTAAGAATVPKDQRNVARVFHLTRRAYVRHILIPHTLGSTITGLRLSMGTAWMVIVAVEMMSGKNGIGFYVWDRYNAGDMPSVAASIVLIGATGLVLDFFFLRLGKAVTKQEAPT